ncbi:MAG: gfo/Idh/MocA family oxidoreductase [Bacteroidetes bacterium]|nr:MAG: gfo/Idh/MocA family oxidoreductase [Bacteroidota bacterium]RLD80069.1 MAG: gfo/Idh/MocA family oxidoreductase [Bacteroidota bacterium]
MGQKRREFIKTISVGSAGLALNGLILPVNSFANVLGANDKLSIAIMGTNSRGNYLAEKFAQAENTEISYICDVDSRVLKKTTKLIYKKTGKKPKAEKDIRKVLEDKNVDVLVIAAPDHWHAPAAIMALQAGKHVYVEKPCSQNPREGELLVEAQKKYGKIVQMGNQQRSSYESIEAVKLIKEGIIGNAYYGKAWYDNNRGSIGYGKETPVPGWLDWDLWQGPAPRKKYKDNYVHYNWHWFWHWGTGEILNNGTHEVDICRWALGVDYPVKASSQGGRYHFKDDWEFYDTQVASFDFKEGKTINWEGKSCNNSKLYNRGRGSAIYGTDGTAIIDRNGYEIYDNSNKLIKEAKAGKANATMNKVGGGDLDGLHITNFLNAIRKGEKQHSPIDEGNKSVTLCQLGNIAQKMQRTLNIDPLSGRIVNDNEAMKMWGREYESGWEIKV